ncbi:hypothetical protein WT81_27680 [Burkholderia stagnalis]|nr:hypothetical protein WT80_17880 [Burkholderia stagnalis]KWK51547.1 hypothetical protein WT81_27680 [Burkholderia stagnalis]
MVLILEAAATVQDDVRKEMSSSMLDAQERVEKLLGLSEDLFDKGMTADLVSRAESVSRRRRAPRLAAAERGKAGSAPVPGTPGTNRGVTTTHTNPARSAPSKAGREVVSKKKSQKKATI